MPFDFNGGKPRRTSVSSRPPAPPSRGFQNRPSEGGAGGFTSEPDRPQNRPGGFQERPEVSGRSAGQTPAPSGSGPRPSRARPVRRPTLRGSAPSIPWNLVIPLLLAVAVVALLVIYRQAIIQFLADILSLVVVLAVVLCILKLILFGRK